jgi:hypothetical protein
VIIALIVEEAIPLIAIWYPEMLPSTCILPSQRERMQKEAVEKSLATVAKFGSPLRSLARAADNGEIPLDYLAQIHDGQMPRAFCGCVLSCFHRQSLTLSRFPGSCIFRPLA